MDIMTFRVTLRSMLDKLPSDKQDAANTRVQYTLNILGQETMSREAIAIILAQY